MDDLLKLTSYQLNKVPTALQNTIHAQASYIYQSQFDNPLDFGQDAMALGWLMITCRADQECIDWLR